MKRYFIFVLACILVSTCTYATTSINFFNNKWGNANLPFNKIRTIVTDNFSIDDYRAVKVQVIYNNKHLPDHLLVFLLEKKYHSFKLARVNIDYQYHVLSIQNDYRVTQADKDQQPGKPINEVTCPDSTIEFIAFAPNDMEIEQDITKDVALAAKSHNLKTVSLLIENATRDNYLNYMSCPKLVGNFYDGDSDPFMILTVDGFIYADDIKTLLENKFRFKVTNYWLACFAFNEPMQSSVIVSAQAQKYAAGISALLIGPSDLTAACAIKKAMDHKPMKQSFDECYKLFDTAFDKWGYDGLGSDYFGQ